MPLWRSISSAAVSVGCERGPGRTSRARIAAILYVAIQCVSAILVCMQASTSDTTVDATAALASDPRRVPHEAPAHHQRAASSSARSRRPASRSPRLKCLGILSEAERAAATGRARGRARPSPPPPSAAPSTASSSAARSGARRTRDDRRCKIVSRQRARAARPTTASWPCGSPGCGASSRTSSHEEREALALGPPTRSSKGLTL